jgi:hypothetical protein
VKVSGNPHAFYGQLYLQRKEQEERKNAAGEFAATATMTLETKNFDKSTEAYKAYAEGRLPKGRIHARAQRYAVKLFLAHLHEVAYRHKFGEAPPAPYPIAMMGHVDKVEVPGAPWVAGGDGGEE